MKMNSTQIQKAFFVKKLNEKEIVNEEITSENESYEKCLLNFYNKIIICFLYENIITKEMKRE